MLAGMEMDFKAMGIELTSEERVAWRANTHDWALEPQHLETE